MAKQNGDSSYTESKFIRELRKQNQRLKAENRQLRKENERLRSRTDDDPFADEQEAMVFESVGPVQDQISCPECGTYTKNIFLVAGKRYFRCESCGCKGPVTKATER